MLGPHFPLGTPKRCGDSSNWNLFKNGSCWFVISDMIYEDCRMLPRVDAPSYIYRLCPRFSRCKVSHPVGWWKDAGLTRLCIHEEADLWPCGGQGGQNCSITLTFVIWGFCEVFKLFVLVKGATRRFFTQCCLLFKIICTNILMTQHRCRYPELFTVSF